MGIHVLVLQAKRLRESFGFKLKEDLDVARTVIHKI